VLKVGRMTEGGHGAEGTMEGFGVLLESRPFFGAGKRDRLEINLLATCYRYS